MPAEEEAAGRKNRASPSPSRVLVSVVRLPVTAGRALQRGWQAAISHRQAAPAAFIFLLCTMEKSNFDITFMIIVIKLEKHFNVNAWGLLDRALHLKISKHSTKAACY